jgi:hypothetical protein
VHFSRPDTICSLTLLLAYSNLLAEKAQEQITVPQHLSSPTKQQRMARKRKRKKNRLKSLLLFIVTPVFVWLLAFVVWFYWNSITLLFRQGELPPKARPKAARKIDQSDPADKGVKERISDEERKKLDEILKKQVQ